MMDLEAVPRLSSRLLLALHNVHTLTPLELTAQRKALCERGTTRASEDKASFTLSKFLPNAHSFSAEEVQLVRRHFQCFLELVGALCDGSTLHKNAALTLYNLATRNSREKAHMGAQSVFGFIDRDRFASLAAHAQALCAFADRTHRGAEHHDHEFGFDLEFAVPSSSMDASLFAIDRDRERATAPADDERDSDAEREAEAHGEALDLRWFEETVQQHVRAFSSPFSEEQFRGEVVRICRESVSQGDLEGALFELVGEDFDLLSLIVQNSAALKQYDQFVQQQQRQQRQQRQPSETVRAKRETDFVSSQSAAFESLSANQKKKVLLREQREMERAMQIAAEQDALSGGSNNDWLRRLGFDEEMLCNERALGLQKNRVFEGWSEGLAPEGSREYHEKRGLPAGATRAVYPGYEEVFLPAAKHPPAPAEHELVSVASLEPWAQLAFPGTKSLNRIQSRVFPCAFHSSENMLVCAPTGAGKTNIAMLSLLQLARAYLSVSVDDNGAATVRVDAERAAAMKAIYVAPMKALAQEVVTKFSERLAPLGLVVREYTGDTELSRQEIADAHLLVCTPEKYDVATRKGGDGSLGTLVSLIIIDEVHLLADERGAVIETIVARTQRYVESSQRIVRIVGLSATLPNYEDVATFLRVNRSTGLFFFGPEYRPIPLDQTFLGVTEKQRIKRVAAMNKLAFDKMIAALDNGKQVMIFVHSRKDTSRTLESILDLCAKYGTYDRLENAQHEKYTLWKREVDRSRSQEVQALFAKGVAVHHAGMLRSDRSLVERLFEQGLVKVLCCTATLAWGVNLPAHTVIVKGTEMYDPERGGFVDLSILDVLQIFGRAGRPQYDNTGHAVLITPHKSLSLYLGMLAQQAPIESALIKSLADHLNAEIVNGTVSNVKEAAQWLSYTFLFVRMRQNPLVYGINYEDMFADPQLEAKRLQLVRDAAETLDTCMMTRFDKRSGNLAVTDMGRVASHYYIKHTTVQAFNNMLAPHMSDTDAVHVLCSSAEFEQLKVRPEELAEMDQLRKHSFLNVRTAADDTAGKVSLLLQGYLSGARISSFTLQSDTNFVAQNAGRISRALFEICLKRGWSTMARYYLCLCKSIDRRVRMDLSPLRQFPDLPSDIVRKLEEAEASYDQLCDMDAREIGELVHNNKFGPKIKELVHRLPMLSVAATVQPITRGIVRMNIELSCCFEWVERVHGAAEAFWVWIEDGENEFVYHSEHVNILRKQRTQTKAIEVTIPVRDPLPPQYYVRVMSDAWVGCETVTVVSFQHLLMPSMRGSAHTDLMDLHPLPKSALQNALFEEMYSFSHFNTVQTQTFHALYNTDRNVLVGAPTGSGKTITAELAILRLLRVYPGCKTIYVAPLKALARERLMDWQKKLGGKLGLRVLELSGEVTPDVEDLRRADVLIVTPEKWDGISRGWQKRDYVKQVGLVIIDEIHLLGVDRGPVLEVIVSRMRFIAAQTGGNVRFVGLSTALANARDLGDWLGIEEGTSMGAVGLYNFRPSVRPVPMSIHIQGFPSKHYCPRMATMNKPAYAAILEHSPTKPVLIFVSSRRQTRLTALDLISYCAADDEPKRFLRMDEEDATSIASTIRDKALKDTLLFGVGIHHAGLDHHDRSVVEELFLNNKIQVLVCTSTLAWGVNLPCHLVIVKGTEYFDGKTKGYVDFPVTDILQMMGRAGRPQFDDSAVACIFVHEPKKNFYRKFLHEPFPVESSLHLQLHEHINAEVANGTIHSLPDAAEYLTWTYFFRRLLMNPSYYQLWDASPAGVQQYLSQLVGAVVDELERAHCVLRVRDELCPAEHYETTALGRIASYYYLHFQTPARFAAQFRQLHTHLLSAQEEAQMQCGLEVPVEVLMKLLCDAAEFAELPVRHNEEHLNAELAQQLGIAATSPLLGSLESPHTKALLLLQAMLRKAKLPISDYINDTKTVLDQVPRVLNAMVDVAAEEGLPHIVVSLARLSQLLSQGVPDCKEAEFLQLRIPEVAAKELMRRGVAGVRALQRQSRKQIENTLTAAAQTAGVAVPEDVLARLEALPTATLRDLRVREFCEEHGQTEEWFASDAAGTVNLPRELDCELQVQISANGAKAKTAQGKKPPSWWAVLVSAPAVDIASASSEKQKSSKKRRDSALALDANAELLALKRLGPLKESQTVSLFFTSPETTGPLSLKVLLLNDAVLGLDQVAVLDSMNVY